MKFAEATDFWQLNEINHEFWSRHDRDVEAAVREVVAGSERHVRLGVFS